MKTTLTPEQSNRLIELGVDPSKASEVKEFDDELSQWTHRGSSLFTLSDILSLLPKEIEVYYDGEAIPFHLVITTNGNGWEVSYCDNEALKIAPELIDALFELLCWVLKNHPEEIK
ncbi:MAG: hypothetical protein NC418_06275 [Muribaculaceae bacterium]|nr:hypothetical protein [Muribaculaceae bacterium]